MKRLTTLFCVAALMFGSTANADLFLVKSKGDLRGKCRVVQKLKHVKHWMIVEADAEGDIEGGEIVERDQQVSIAATPNDPMLSQLWGMSRIEAASAWDQSTGSHDIIVAVIDTGIDWNHPDLAANIWTGPDGEHGYTAMGGVLTVGGMDDNSHGTHCAGTIGAVGNNAVGVVGVNWRVKMIACKFLGAGGSGASSDAALLLDKLIALKQAGHNIRVTSNSWGGGGYLQALRDAFAAATSAGIIHVVAAGNANANNDSKPHYPGAYADEGIVTVQATEWGGSVESASGFSNYGVASTDLAAPGSSIVSTVPGDGYESKSGTSMACPHVAGAAALLLAQRPDLTPKQVRDVLLHPDSLDILDDPDGKMQNSTTQGRLNLRRLSANPYNGTPANRPPEQASTPSPIVIVSGDRYEFSTDFFDDPDGDSIYTGIGSVAVKLIDTMFLLASTPDNGGHITKPSVRNVHLIGTASVADGHGGSTMAEIPLTAFAHPTVANAAPTVSAAFSYPTNSATMKMTVSVSDPENDLTRWAFATSSGFACCLPDYQSGIWPTNYSVRLTVTVADAALNTVQATAVGIPPGTTNQPPVISFASKSFDGIAPLTVTIAVSASDPDGGTLQAVWLNHGDGSGFTSTNPLTHTYTKPGVYVVSAYCYDNGSPRGYAYDSFLISVIPPVEPPPDRCGDGLCDPDETCASCPDDCGICPPPPPVCGDGVCNGDETCSTCPQDCGICPPPPPRCGDGICQDGENHRHCPQDCNHPGKGKK